MTNSHPRQQESDATADAQISTTDTDQVRVPVSGGVLVYETRQLGRELVGFEEVDDWDDLADALGARGHGRGHIYHLPELDTEGSA